MSELENLKSLEKYDNWKKAKKSRKRYISLLSTLIGCSLGILITWLVLKVSPKDTWILTKGVFASEEKIADYEPKMEEIDNKLQKSIVAKPLNFLSKKIGERTAQELLKGNLKAVVDAVRTYCLLLVGIWLVVMAIAWTIFYFIAYGIIAKFMWLEPTLYEQRN